MERRDKVTMGVRFSPDTKENEAFTPLARPHTSAVRKLWFERCRANRHEEFSEDLERFKQRGITVENFFNQEGAAILNRAILHAENSKELYYICQNIPPDLIVKTACDSDFLILRLFLLGESRMEKGKEVSAVDLEERFKKIELLLGLKSDGIKTFLEAALTGNDIEEGLKQQIKQAVAKFSVQFTGF